MCVIVYKPAGHPLPDTETLRACWSANRDGAGMMHPVAGSVRIRKGFMEWDAFEQALSEESAAYDLVSAPVAFHFRIATHGAVKPGCCHPFPVCRSAETMRATEQEASIGFMHNGVLSGLRTSERVSDSMAFAKGVLSPLAALTGRLLSDESARKVIGSSTQGTRFLLMDGTGDVRTFGRWVADNGIMFSNENFRTRLSALPFIPDELPAQLSALDAFAAFGGTEPSDLEQFGLFEACAGCGMVEDCAVDGPYCPNPDHAKELADAFAAG